jgi:hypothetical protein
VIITSTLGNLNKEEALSISKDRDVTIIENTVFQKPSNILLCKTDDEQNPVLAVSR